MIFRGGCLLGRGLRLGRGKGPARPALTLGAGSRFLCKMGKETSPLL